MCLIVDANVAKTMCDAIPAPDIVPVLDWLETAKGQLVHGGKLTDELIQNIKFSRWLATLTRAGRARRISDDAIAQEQANIEQLGLCKSNDDHILAIARASGARLLYSLDKALHADFTNLKILRPKGKVYQNATHAHLLTSEVCKGKC